MHKFLKGQPKLKSKKQLQEYVKTTTTNNAQLRKQIQRNADTPTVKDA